MGLFFFYWMMLAFFPQKPVDCRYVGFFLGSHFHSIDQYGHPYSATILSQLLLFCSNFWNWEYESSHFVLFLPRLFCFFWVPYICILIFNSFLKLQKEKLFQCWWAVTYIIFFFSFWGYKNKEINVFLVWLQYSRNFPKTNSSNWTFFKFTLALFILFFP